MAINPTLTHLREFYTDNQSKLQPLKLWAASALLVSSAAIGIFGNPLFALIGSIIFCYSAYWTIAALASASAVIPREKNEVLTFLAAPGFFEFAMQNDQRYLASPRQMERAFNLFQAAPRPGGVG